MANSNAGRFCKLKPKHPISRVAPRSAFDRLRLLHQTALATALVLVAAAAGDGAMAQPFNGGQAVATVTSTPVAGNCTAYNDQVSQHGAPLNGDHAGYCQFSNARIMVNGVPFDQFWQAVGQIPPPYQMSFSSQLFEQCATAHNLSIDVSMEIQSSRLDWPGAAAVGQACLNEWNRHNPANLVGTSASAAASSAVRRLISYLNINLPRAPIEVCVSGLGLGKKQVSAALANRIKSYMAPGGGLRAQLVSTAAASGGECMLRCSLCSSGWAGTITLGKTFTKGGKDYYNATDTLYVGGTSSNPNRFVAEWTATGSGTYSDSNITLNWSLSADAPGQCDPLVANAACIEAIPQPGGSTLFNEPSSQIVLPKTLLMPCVPGPGYRYTQTPATGVQSPTMCGQVGETQVNGNGISTTLPTMAVGSKTEMSCPERPPLNPGGYSCTQTWNWELYKQP
jgi:hypothetical protein